MYKLKGAYQGAGIPHCLEYLHLLVCLREAQLGRPAVHGHHVGPPERGQVVLRHQILVTLGRHNVQVTYQPPQGVVVYHRKFVEEISVLFQFLINLMSKSITTIFHQKCNSSPARCLRHAGSRP